MESPIHIDTIGMGLPIVYFKGSQVEVFKLCISVPEGCFKQTVQMKCCIKLHFIWVFTVCQSTQGFPVYKGLRAIEKYFSYFSTKTYVVGTQKNRLHETVLLSIQNTCINW